MRILVTVGCLVALNLAAQAHAQDIPDSSTSGEEPSDDVAADDGQATDETADAVQPADSGAAPAERKWSFGPYFRYAWVPSFMLELFLDAAPTIGNAAGGVVANFQPSKDGATFEMGIGYRGFGFQDIFRANGDPPEDTEWLNSSLGLVHLTGSILWNAKIVERLTFQYGIGIDFGIMTGELRRTEAYVINGVWRPCRAKFDPLPQYCEQTANVLAATDAFDQVGAQYNVVETRVPPIGLVPMLPHLALRYEPVDNLAFKFEAGYGIVDLWLGLAASYAPPL